MTQTSVFTVSITHEGPPLDEAQAQQIVRATLEPQGRVAPAHRPGASEGITLHALTVLPQDLFPVPEDYAPH